MLEKKWTSKWTLWTPIMVEQFNYTRLGHYLPDWCVQLPHCTKAWWWGTTLSCHILTQTKGHRCTCQNSTSKERCSLKFNFICVSRHYCFRCVCVRPSNYVCSEIGRDLLGCSVWCLFIFHPIFNKTIPIGLIKFYIHLLFPLILYFNCSPNPSTNCKQVLFHKMSLCCVFASKLQGFSSILGQVSRAYELGIHLYYSCNKIKSSF